MYHMGWVALSASVSVATLGVAPAMYAWGLRRRKHKYDELFRHGQFTLGVIRSVDKPAGGIYATFKYDFEVADSSYVAFMEYPVEMAKYWGTGDTVPVLYDPGNPSRCCFVYR
jgi:hypothetical protein